MLAAAVICTGVPLPGVGQTVEVKAEESTDDFVIEDGVLKSYKGDGGDVVIPDGVTSIGDYAFVRCSGLTSMHRKIIFYSWKWSRSHRMKITIHRAK